MSFDYYEHINELTKSDPLKAIQSLERHERDLLNNPIDLHFAYNSMISIYYKNRENEIFLNKCIEICKKDIELYPVFKEHYVEEEHERLQSLLSSYKALGLKEEFQKLEKEIEEYKYINLRIPSFKQLAIIYEKQKEYKRAIEICELALKYELEDGTRNGFKGRIERLRKKINSPPKIAKPPKEETLQKHKVLKSSALELATNSLPGIQDGFMITFSKSTSANFERALFLAKQADDFNISTHNNQEIYQATYRSENYLNFITLYELIENWKSTFVFKNGNLIDRKILGQINYCYGDKLRSASKAFCYGASLFTENPFGCHRLMIHEGQKPWYKWVEKEDSRYVYIDKQGIKEQIDSKTKVFNTCPSFNYENIMKVFTELPDRIDKKSKLYRDLYNRGSDSTVTLKLELDEPNKTVNKNNGCAPMIATIVGIGTWLLFFNLYTL